MLLEKFRSIALRATVLLTVLNILAIVAVFALSNLYDRFIVLVGIIAASSISLELCNQVVRIEPITALYEEWTDATVTEALFNKPDLIPAKPKDDSLLISELPLNHYLFLGETRIENRNKFIAAFQLRYPDLELFDTADVANKPIYTALVNERQNGSEKRNPIIMISSKFDTKVQTVTKINIFFFVESAVDDKPINLKVVDQVMAKAMHPNAHKITLGLIDSTKGTINQLRG